MFDQLVSKYHLHPIVDHFTIDLPAAAVAGVPINVTVTARNQAGDVVNYGGSVNLSVNDGQAAMPMQAAMPFSSPITPAAGRWLCNATPVTPGRQAPARIV